MREKQQVYDQNYLQSHTNPLGSSHLKTSIKTGQANWMTGRINVNYAWYSIYIDGVFI